MENIKDEIFERKMTRITMACCDIMMIIMMILDPSWITLAFLGFFAGLTYLAFRKGDDITNSIANVPTGNCCSYGYGDECDDEGNLETFLRRNNTNERVKLIPQVKIFDGTTLQSEELNENLNKWLENSIDDIEGDIKIEVKVTEGGYMSIIVYYIAIFPEEGW